MPNMTDGALAGIAATIPMTVTMAAIHHYPERENLRLPMEEVGHGLAKKIKVYRRMDDVELDTFTWVSHFAFGGAAGALFPLVLKERDPHAVTKGVAFGLGVWAANYLGALPALGIMRPVQKQPKRHVGLEVAAHIVWGAALGWIASRSASRSSH